METNSAFDVNRNITLSEPGQCYVNILHIALILGSKSIFKLLSLPKLDVNVTNGEYALLNVAITAGNIGAVNALLKFPEIRLNEKNGEFSPLTQAIATKNYLMTSLFTRRRDVDINLEVKYGFTPLQIALIFDQGKDLDFIRLFTSRLDIRYDSRSR